MPDLDAFTVEGLNVDMYGGDDEHPPPHFHIRKGNDWEIVVYYRECFFQQRLIFDVQFWKGAKRRSGCPLNKTQKKRLLRLILENIDQLEDQWNAQNP